MKQVRSKRSRSGFMLLDTVAGLMLLLAMIVLVTNVTTRAHRAAIKLAAQRAAARLAETALLQRAADPQAALPAHVEMHLRDDAAPDGYAWATVTAEVDAGHATLIGLVRRSAVTPEVAR